MKPTNAIRFISLIMIALTIFISADIKAQTKTIVLDNPDKASLQKQGIEVQLNNNDSLAQISGVVEDSTTREGIPFATIKIYYNENLYTGTVSDVNGKFCINMPVKGLSGSLGLTVEEMLHDTLSIKNIPLLNNKYFMKLELGVRPGRIIVDYFYLWDPPLLDLNNTSTGHTFNQAEIEHMPW